MMPHRPQPHIFGKYSLVRHVLVRGLVLAGMAALLVGYKTGSFEVRPLLAIAGLSASTDAGFGSAQARSALASGMATSGGDCRPFVCAAGPRPKWVAAPTSTFAAADEPNDVPAPLIVRSALTGEPFPAPDKTPISFVRSSTPRGAGPAVYP